MTIVQDELMHYGVLGMKWGKRGSSIEKYEKKAIKAHTDIVKLEKKAKAEYDPKTGKHTSRLTALTYVGKAMTLCRSTDKMAKHISELDTDSGKKYFEEHKTPNWLVKDVQRNIKSNQKAQVTKEVNKEPYSSTKKRIDDEIASYDKEHPGFAKKFYDRYDDVEMWDIYSPEELME